MGVAYATRAAKLRASEPRAFEFRMSEAGISEPRAIELRISEAQTSELQASGPALRLSAPETTSLERLEAPAPHLAADRMACELGLAADRLGAALCRTAAAYVALGAWTPCGYSRLGDFTREVLGRSGRWLRDLATLGRGLRSLPGLESALLGLDGGPALGRVAATAIARVATPASLPAWINRARACTVRELQDAVRSAREAGANAPPGAACEPSPCRRVLDEETEDAATCAVRLALPRPVAVAFEETLDLHRAVSGHQASVASFVEALAAEAAAGRYPPDASLAPRELENARRALEEQSALEARWARDTRLWAHLAAARPAGATTPVAETVRVVLLKCEALSKHAGEGAAPDLVHQLRELVALEDEIERRLGRLLQEMDAREDWAVLGFASLAHYSEQRLGISRRTAERRTGLVRTLQRLPILLAAYEDGQVGLQAAWLVRRILGPGPVRPGLEQAWVVRARQATVKRLRDEARWVELRAHGLVAAQTGDDGSDPPWPPTDAAWHASLCRTPGMARERVHKLGRLALCPPDPAPAPGHDRIPPASDTVFLRLELPEDIATVFLVAVEGARQGLQAEVASRPGVVTTDLASPGSLLAASRLWQRSGAVPTWVGLLALLEDYVTVWDDERAFPKRDWHETYDRDGWRCMAPGCTGRRRIQDHHLVYRSRQGSDDLWNQLSLCRAHHLQGEHGEFAHCRGKAPLDVTWRIGREDLGTWFRNERRCEAPDGE